MKNTMLPTKEVELVKKAVAIVDELIEVHSHTSVEDLMDLGATKFGRVQTIMYLDFIKDFIRDAKALNRLVDMTEEEFCKDLEEHGTNLDEFERKLMMKMLLEVLDN